MAKTSNRFKLKYGTKEYKGKEFTCRLIEKCLILRRGRVEIMKVTLYFVFCGDDS